MALTQCKECGKEVSQRAKSCPHCGVKMKITTTPLAKGCGCFALVAFCLVTYLALFVSKPIPIPTSTELNVGAAYVGGEFEISNKDSFDWTEVELKVNEDFSLYVPLIKAGTTQTIGALRFAKKNGEALNPWQYKPLRLDISCKTPTGIGFFSGNWR
jgi:hypothetical protein